MPRGTSAGKVAQALRHIGAHGQTQRRLVTRAQGGKDHTVMLRRLVSAQA